MAPINPTPPPSPPIYVCDIYGTEILDPRCELQCPTSGFMRDCSDP